VGKECESERIRRERMGENGYLFSFLNNWRLTKYKIDIEVLLIYLHKWEFCYFWDFWDLLCNLLGNFFSIFMILCKYIFTLITLICMYLQ
jgi:hypothetical protein